MAHKIKHPQNKDWQREQETLFVLQNNFLMQQISLSKLSHQQNQGYRPSIKQLNDIKIF